MSSGDLKWACSSALPLVLGWFLFNYLNLSGTLPLVGLMSSQGLPDRLGLAIYLALLIPYSGLLNWWLLALVRRRLYRRFANILIIDDYRLWALGAAMVTLMAIFSIGVSYPVGVAIALTPAVVPPVLMVLAHLWARHVDRVEEGAGANAGAPKSGRTVPEPHSARAGDDFPDLGPSATDR